MPLAIFHFEKFNGGPVDDHVRRTIATYDIIAPHYGVTATSELRAWEESSMRLFAGYLSGTKVLVPGCGDGRDSRYLSSLGLDVLSFDLSDGMLQEARKLDGHARYVKLDLREVSSLAQTFDGVYASGCLYHLSRREFEAFIRDTYVMLELNGVFYLNMKIGIGEEYSAVPGDRYPGGEQARQLLTGDRYYVYYQRKELAHYLRSYQLLHERDIQYAEEAVELWVRKSPEANQGRQV